MTAILLAIAMASLIVLILVSLVLLSVLNTAAQLQTRVNAFEAVEKATYGASVQQKRPVQVGDE